MGKGGTIHSEHWWMQHRKLDAFWREIAWLLPHRVVAWCGYRLWAHATAGEYTDVVTDMTADQLMDRWQSDKGGDRKYGARRSRGTGVV